MGWADRPKGSETAEAVSLVAGGWGRAQIKASDPFPFYPDTGRRESCLLAGFADNGKPVHIVCGSQGEWMVVVTVYIPTPPKFLTPFERGGD